MLEEDRTLLDAFRRGDRDALTAVFRHYADDVAATLRAGVVVETEGRRVRVGAQWAEAELEALLHDTFARAFAPRARQAYDGIRPFGAYLATIARNLLIDRARQARRDARLVAVDDIDATVAAEPVDPTWRIEEGELGAALAEVRDGLAEPDRSIFRLRFEEQHSVRGAADALGLTEIVVRRRDTQLRTQILNVLRARGFLKNAQVRIGASLLRRRKAQES